MKETLSDKREASILKLARSSMRWEVKVMRFIVEITKQDKEFIQKLNDIILSGKFIGMRDIVILAGEELINNVSHTKNINGVENE